MPITRTEFERGKLFPWRRILHTAKKVILYLSPPIVQAQFVDYWIGLIVGLTIAWIVWTPPLFEVAMIAAGFTVGVIILGIWKRWAIKQRRHEGVEKNSPR